MLNGMVLVDMLSFMPDLDSCKFVFMVCAAILWKLVISTVSLAGTASVLITVGM